MLTGLPNNGERFPPTTGSPKGTPFIVVTGTSQPFSTPLFVVVPNLSNTNQLSINISQYSFQPNAIETQLISTTPDPVSLMVQQVAFRKSTSTYTVPANHVLPNLSLWRLPTARCSVSNVTSIHSTPQGLSRAPNINAPNMNGDNNDTVLQMVSVTSVDTVYYLNPTSGPNLVDGAMPNNISSKAQTNVWGTKIMPARAMARSRAEHTAFIVQDLCQLLASSRTQHLPNCQLQTGSK